MQLACDGRNQEQRAHSPDEHHAADDDFSDRGEFFGESHRESACGIRAHNFEQNFEERGAIGGVSGACGDFGTEEDERCRCNHDYGNDENSNGFINGVVWDGASHDLGLFPAKQPVYAQKPDDCCGRNLDAATTATRVCADEHDDNKEE